ncbi:MAG: hypothetical protein ACE5JG_03060 [Planctomycetota bacterium]
MAWMRARRRRGRAAGRLAPLLAVLAVAAPPAPARGEEGPTPQPPRPSAGPQIHERLLKLVRWYLAEESPSRREDFLEAIETLVGDDLGPLLGLLRAGRHRTLDAAPRLRTDDEPPAFDGEEVELRRVASSAGHLAVLEPPDPYDPQKTYPLILDLGFSTRLPLPHDAFRVHLDPRRYAGTAQGVESLVLSLQRYLLGRFPIDPERVFLHGDLLRQLDAVRLAWYVALHNPDRFAGVLAGRKGWKGGVRLAPNGAHLVALAIAGRNQDPVLAQLVAALKRHNEAHRLLHRPRNKGDTDLLPDIRHWWSYARRKSTPARISLVIDRPEPMRAFWLRAHPKVRSVHRAKVAGRTARRMRIPATIEAEVVQKDLIVVKTHRIVAFDLYVDPRLIDVEAVRVSIDGSKVPQARAVFPNVADLLEDFAERRDPALLSVCKLTFTVGG